MIKVNNLKSEVEKNSILSVFIIINVKRLARNVGKNLKLYVFLKSDQHNSNKISIFSE